MFFIIELIFFLSNNMFFFILFLFFNMLLMNNFFMEFNFYMIIILMMFLFSYFYIYNLFYSFSMKMLLKLNLIFSMIFFFTKNIMMFYIFYEFSIYPILILISIWGYQIERIQASSFFLGFTLFSSIPSFFIIILLKLFEKNFLNFFNYYFNNMLLFFLILMFLTKLPIFLFHIWLPKAHVEAPTVGSILLAAILLKLGAWGMMKFMVIFNLNILNISLMFISFLGTIYTSFLCFLQSDMKALIAYSSVVHMNFLLLGILLKFNMIKFNILIILFFHAFVSSMMFFKAGFSFYFMKTRLIYFNSLSSYPTNFILILLILIFVLNFNLPPSLGVMPEIYIFTSLFSFNNLYFFFLLIFGLISAFFCIFILMNFSSGKICFSKMFKMNMFMKMMNMFTIVFIMNILLMILF